MVKEKVENDTQKTQQGNRRLRNSRMRRTGHASLRKRRSSRQPHTLTPHTQAGQNLITSFHSFPSRLIYGYAVHAIEANIRPPMLCANASLLQYVPLVSFFYEQPTNQPAISSSHILAPAPKDPASIRLSGFALSPACPSALVLLSKGLDLTLSIPAVPSLSTGGWARWPSCAGWIKRIMVSGSDRRCCHH